MVGAVVLNGPPQALEGKRPYLDHVSLPEPNAGADLGPTSHPRAARAPPLHNSVPSVDLVAKAGDNPPVGSKIKWNDDRVRGAATALLLISRDRIARGRTGNLVASSLAEYRVDPEGYKAKRKAWPEVRDPGMLGDPGKVARYQALLGAVDKLLAQWTQSKRQFNSLLELDNALVEQLGAI
jgi:hypothetical protein